LRESWWVFVDVLGSVLEAIGNTPLVELRKLNKSKARVFAKLEFLNPGGSVKDRMALRMVEDAERRGLLKPGGTIVENTSGNTGAALAMVAAVKGYKTIFTIPDKMSREKIDALKAFGAKVVVTPTNVAPDDPRSYYSVAKKIAEETPNSFYANQCDNPANVDAHYRATGPEIWEQTNGEITHLVAGAGTGGTVSGTSRFLKEKNPAIRTIAVDPVGSVYYDLFYGNAPSQPGSYAVEGIGEDKKCTTMMFEYIDEIVRVTDGPSFEAALRLAREEGIFAGGSSGAAVSAALGVAEKAGDGGVVVAILPDGGAKYLSKFYNEEWYAKFKAVKGDV
jgi:cystathionine beta-synthase